VVLAAGILAACTDRDDELTAVNIRIQNSSTIAFTEVRFVGKDTVYGNIAAGDYSEYLAYERVFQETDLTIKSDSTNFNFISTAQFEEPLPIGFYTYELSFDVSDQVKLNFKVD